MGILVVDRLFFGEIGTLDGGMEVSAFCHNFELSAMNLSHFSCHTFIALSFS